jgi:hypothetical protein
MKDSVQNLEGNEAILLMYMADELPQADRLEVERMLATDAGLRGELEILRQTQKLAYDSLKTLDSMTRPATPPIVALGQVSRLIHQWAEQRRQPVAAVAAVHQPLPWRRISATAAAVLVVGYYIWAVYQPAKLPPPPPSSIVTDEYNPVNPDDISPVPQARELSSQEKLALLANSLEDSASDEASNLDVAQVAAVTPADSSDQNVTGEP